MLAHASHSLSLADCSWRSQRTALRLVMAETPQEAYETSMRSWLTEPVDSESDDDYDDDDDDKERQPRGRCARGRWRGRGRRVVGACGRGGRTVNSSSYLAQIRRI